MSLLRQIARQGRVWVLRQGLLGGGRKPRHWLAPGLQMRLLGLAGQHVFCGYYDVCPMTTQGSVLAHAVRCGANPERDALAIVCHDGARWAHLGETHAWCWQQGARLRWHPCDETTVGYNTLKGHRWQRLDGTVEDMVGRPLYDVSGDGRWGLTLDFGRLQALRPGYGFGACDDLDEAAPGGIELVDLRDHSSREVVSLDELATSVKAPGARHYVNHLSFSPDGRRFLFFHLWLDSVGQRHAQAWVQEMGDGQRRAVTDAGERVSHYGWSGNRLLLTVTEAGGRLVYRLLDLDDASHTVLLPEVLTMDGHPGVRPGRAGGAGGAERADQWITDSYPDRYGEQRLLLIEGGCRVLGGFYAPLRYHGERRCDLHPRWSPAGDRLIIDTTLSGVRSVGIITL